MSVYATARSWSPDSRFLVYRIEGNGMEGYCGCGGGPVPKPREAEYGFYRYDEVGRFSGSYPNPTHYFRVSSDGKTFAFVAGFEGTASQEDVSADGKRMAVHARTAGDSGGRSVSWCGRRQDFRGA